MQRRDFIRLAGYGPMLGVLAAPLVAHAASQSPALLLVDRRFAETRALAGRACYASCARLEIDGDLTALWNGPWRNCRAGASELAGLTTGRTLHFLESLTHEWGWRVLQRRTLARYPQTLVEWRIGPG